MGCGTGSATRDIYHYLYAASIAAKVAAPHCPSTSISAPSATSQRCNCSSAGMLAMSSGLNIWMGATGGVVAVTFSGVKH